MKEQIIAQLRETPDQKAKDLARVLGCTRKEVNITLHQNGDLFHQDDEYRWNLTKPDSLMIELPGNKWVDAVCFEETLTKTGCLLTSACQAIVFVVPLGCKILLDAAARLLAICNQLVLDGKDVTIDFSDCQDTLHYLDRVGLYQHLDDRVSVLPYKPKVSAADIYRGNNEAVVEFGAICPDEPDDSIPIQLKNSFVVHAGKKYSMAAFTVFSELFGNVCEHSETPIPGFAALQKYGGKRPHVQTVVSDSGRGIVGTLRPNLATHYPELAARYDFSDPMASVLLLKEVLEYGRITQTGCPDETSRGLGLKRSQEYAVNYNANISIRQDTFELSLFYTDGELVDWTHSVDMPLLRGTHVCFDFILD